MPEIRSNSAENSSKPWFEFTVKDGLQIQFNAANGLGTYTDGPPDDLAHLLGTHDLALDPDKPGEIHVLAVRLDGQYEFVPSSDQQGEYYAHLGWYNPDSGAWDTLEFVE